MKKVTKKMYQDWIIKQTICEYCGKKKKRNWNDNYICVCPEWKTEMKRVCGGSYSYNKQLDCAKIKFKEWNFNKHKDCWTFPYIFNMYRASLCDEKGEICGGRTNSEKIKITPISLCIFIKNQIYSYFYLKKLNKKWRKHESRR